MSFPQLPFVMRLVWPIVTSVILDRLVAFRKDLDWTKVKRDADKHVRDLIPGEMFDESVVMFVNRQINNVYESLAKTDMFDHLLELIGNGEWATAGQEILDHAFPSGTTK